MPVYWYHKQVLVLSISIFLVEGPLHTLSVNRWFCIKPSTFDLGINNFMINSKIFALVIIIFLGFCEYTTYTLALVFAVLPGTFLTGLKPTDGDEGTLL